MRREVHARGLLYSVSGSMLEIINTVFAVAADTVFASATATATATLHSVQHLEAGRCGPLFNEARCDCSQASWAMYQFCNSANGWCGDTAGHANADDLTEYDCLTSPLRVAAETALGRKTSKAPASSAKSTAAETKKENELFSWLRDKAGLSQAVIEKSKAKLSEEDVDSVEALQALYKLGDLADVFSRVPAQQIADALLPEVKKNPWETGEPGHWDTSGQWVSDAPTQEGEHGTETEKGSDYTPPVKPVPSVSLPPEEVRCGPLFNRTRCDCSQASWAVFCNSENGWCGDTAEHASADELTKYDCLTQLRRSQPAEGRCGLLFNGTKCDCSGVFQFCNSETGWCGDTAEHANSDDLTRYDCPNRVRMSQLTEGRCGPLFNGTKCDCSGVFQFCNSVNGWCGDSAEHKSADDFTRYDCRSPADAAAAPVAQGLRDPRSLEELENKLRDLELSRCLTAGKRCQTAPAPAPPDNSKRAESTRSSKPPPRAGGADSAPSTGKGKLVNALRQRSHQGRMRP